MFTRAPLRFFAREPGKGMRIHAPPVRDFMSQEHGWSWLERWDAEMEEVKQKAKKIRKKVPYCGTDPEAQSVRMAKKEWHKEKRRLDSMGKGDGMG